MLHWIHSTDILFTMVYDLHISIPMVFFQSNTHIVSCAVRTRPCLLLTCFRFIRVLQKLIMKLELNICHLHVLKTSRFKLQCKAIFPKTFALFINHIFIFDK